MDRAVRQVRRALGLIVVGASLLTLAGGCKNEPAKVDVTGKLLKNGEPLKVSKLGQVSVTFIAEQQNPDSPSYHRTAQVDESGAFQIKAIATGKYKVAVSQVDPYPKTDLLKGAYNKDNTPIVREVQEPNQVFEIDLAKEKKPAS